MGEAYIIAALMKFLGMKKTSDEPVTYPFNDGDDPQSWFDDVLKKFVWEFILQAQVDAKVDEDGVMSYGYFTIFVAMLHMQMKDAAAEGDGDRNLKIQKYLISVFKSLSAYSKYAIEMFLSVAEIECLLPEQLAARFKYGFFVNYKGGVGRNIEADLAQEIANKLTKAIVKRMGANKAIPSISKVCKAIGGIKEIVENFDETLNLHQTNSKHKTRSSLEDEKGMIQDLLGKDVFTCTPGRHHTSFQDIRRSPLRHMNIVHFHDWLEKQRGYLSQ